MRIVTRSAHGKSDYLLIGPARQMLQPLRERRLSWGAAGFLCFLVVFWMLSGCCARSRTIVFAAASPEAEGLAQEQAIEKLLERRAEALAHLGLGTIADLRGDTNTALEEFLLSLKLDPSNEELLVDVCNRLVQLGRTQEAYDLLAEAAKRPDVGARTFALLGQICLGLDRLQEAKQAFQRATELKPVLLLPYQGLAELAFRSKDKQEALKWLSLGATAGLDDPQFAAEFASWVSFQVSVGRLEIEDIKDWVKRAYDTVTRDEAAQPMWIEATAVACQRVGLVAEAIKGYERLLKVFEESGAPSTAIGLVHQRLISLYSASGDRAGLRRHLESLRALQPTNPFIHLMLGVIALEETRVEEAINAFSQALKLDPQLEEAYYRLASAQISLGKYEEALQTLEQARKRFPPNFYLEFYTGLAVSGLGDPRQALWHLLSAEIHAKVSQQKIPAFFYFELGVVYHLMGRWSKAEGALKQAIELDPNLAVALNYLGYSWAEMGINLEEALQLIKRAVELDPDNPAYMDSLGWVYYRLGRLEEALQTQLKAIKLSEDKPDPVLFEHLGDVYAAIGRWSDAIEAWRRAWSLEPSETLVHKILEAESHLGHGDGSDGLDAHYSSGGR